MLHLLMIIRQRDTPNEMFCCFVADRGSRIGGKKLFDLGKATEGFSGRRIKAYTESRQRPREKKRAYCRRGEAEGRKETGNSGPRVLRCKKKGSPGTGTRKGSGGGPLLSRSPSVVDTMIVSSCYTRRNGVIRFKEGRDV